MVAMHHQTVRHGLLWRLLFLLLLAPLYVRGNSEGVCVLITMSCFFSTFCIINMYVYGT